MFDLHLILSYKLRLVKMLRIYKSEQRA